MNSEQQNRQKPIMVLLSSNVSIISFFRRLFAKEFHILKFENGKEALESLINLEVEVFILDAKIETVHLLDLCKKIYEIKKPKTAPLLLISNNLKNSFTIQALEAGVTDFLGLPLDAEEIKQRLLIASHSIQEKVAAIAKKIDRKGASNTAFDISLRSHTFSYDEQSLQASIQKQKIFVPLQVLFIKIDAYEELAKKSSESAQKHFATLQEILEGKLRMFDLLFPKKKGDLILLLGKTSPSAAFYIAEDIREEGHLAWKEENITLSIGIASIEKLPEKEEESLSLIKGKIKSAMCILEGKENITATEAP